MLTKVILLGASGTALDVLGFLDELNEREPTYECVGFLDDDRVKWGTRLQGVPVLGPITDAPRWANAQFVDALGGPGSFTKREQIVARTGLPASRFETVIHPSARVSRCCTIGHGTILYPGVFVGSNARVGQHVTVLANSVINHEATVADYSILASAVSVSGGVTIGRACYLGAGSHVIQNAVVGDGSLVGMGSIVLHDVPEGSVVVGNPARILRRHGDGARG